MAEQEPLDARVTRLEESTVALNQATAKLDNAMAHLAEVQARQHTELDGINLTIAGLRKEAIEREKRIDDRIEKLVIAIGEFIARSNGKQSPQ